jgi:hypothetical protein
MYTDPGFEIRGEQLSDLQGISVVQLQVNAQSSLPDLQDLEGDSRRIVPIVHIKITKTQGRQLPDIDDYFKKLTIHKKRKTC